jgi:hypothetical protein
MCNLVSAIAVFAAVYLVGIFVLGWFQDSLKMSDKATHGTAVLLAVVMAVIVGGSNNVSCDGGDSGIEYNGRTMSPSPR